MERNDKVAEHMDLIRNLFQQSSVLASEMQEDSALIAQLEQSDKTFQSIAYEASAMERALLDFSNNDYALPLWQAFLRQAPQHSIQIHVGLGWALSKRKLAIQQIAAPIDAMQLPRVLDGLGYCDGTFRYRMVVKEKTLHEWLAGDTLRGYDQGLGRSLWYSSKGKPEALAETISTFDEARRADMWRGVGIAVAYVGGCAAERLAQLKTASTIFVIDVAVGVQLATLSRKHAGTINADTELICNQICNSDPITIFEFAENASLLTDDYFQWLALLKERLT